MQSPGLVRRLAAIWSPVKATGHCWCKQTKSTLYIKQNVYLYTYILLCRLLFTFHFSQSAQTLHYALRRMCRRFEADHAGNLILCLMPSYANLILRILLCFIGYYTNNNLREFWRWEETYCYLITIYLVYPYQCGYHDEYIGFRIYAKIQIILIILST